MVSAHPLLKINIREQLPRPLVRSAHRVPPTNASSRESRLQRQRHRLLQQPVRPLVTRKIVVQERRNGEIYYSADPQLRAHKAEIVRYVNHPAKLRGLATKRRPSVKVTVQNN